MIELVQLERRHDDFPKRNTRVLVVSVEGLDDARKTQADFPHLIVLADQARSLSEMAGLIHPHAAPDGGDADVPTTILVDRHGTVRMVISFARGDCAPVAGRGFAGDRPAHPVILRPRFGDIIDLLVPKFPR